MIDNPSQPPVYDTLIIGGGPGGLTAAIYLRRFMRKLALFDRGNSRAAWIPVSHNYPGFPDGVHGPRLLENLRAQLGRYGGEVRALTVLLATGIADVGLPVERWREAIARGAVRLCPVCDGYDVIDKRIAVVSSETNPIGHAMFMRAFSADVTLFDRSETSILTDEERQRLEAAGVRYVSSMVRDVRMSEAMTPILNTANGESYEFDVMYPMLGETARSELAVQLGAETADCGDIVVDDHQATSVAGLYAIGDVVVGLNQISVAAGQAAVAATRIHNTLPWTLRQKTPAA
jgi:thioredoxin reductase (NADPH)